MRLYKVKGYFTTESNIRGLTPAEIERVLGLPFGYLADGARILLLAEPKPWQYIPAGSTLFPGAAGLGLEQLEATKYRPGAWYRERLVKVKSVIDRPEPVDYPKAIGIASEQWILKEYVDSHEICELKAGDRYWC